MFDDRLFDIIMGEMMSTFGADVRTDEGSLAYNACAKIAQKIEEVYGDMLLLNDNLLVDTMDLAHLIAYAGERGIAYNYATAPVVKGVFNQAIDYGERLSCGNYVYFARDKIADFVYKLECSTAGTEANTNFGALSPVDYIDNYLGGTITEIITAGTDNEDQEAFRKRIIKSFEAVAFGGNRADYRKFINELVGVGGCKPIRRAPDSSWINVYIVNEQNHVPSLELVNEVQTAVDPTENSGAGDGLAPICHSVKIFPAEGVNINVSAHITFDVGYSVDTSLEAIKEAIKLYLEYLCSTWEGLDLSSMQVRIAQIEARILSVEGVVDVTNLTINGASSNVSLTYSQIPVLGGVVIV